MSSPLPEDVHREITKAVMAFSKGKLGEERDSLRKLRDSTLLSLSMTSREISSVSLPALYRNVTATPFNSRFFVLHPRSRSSPFINTRSLTLGILKPGEELTKEMRERILHNEDEAKHADLEELREKLIQLDEELTDFLDSSESIPDALKKKILAVQASRLASTFSIIIESMPNLQLLELRQWAFFYFAKLERKSESEARFSRPLSGLSSLRILKLGKSILQEISGANCVWLMIFLPELTHLKAYVEFRSSDEKFFRDHQEVLVGKSNVTHLELVFRNAEDQILLWDREQIIETEILEKLLSATKGLKELKLCNVSETYSRFDKPPSLVFLRSLKPSFNSLKYLDVSGVFTRSRWESETADKRNKCPVSINLESLEMISFDCLSARMLRFPEEKSRIRLSLPSLKSSYFQAGAELQGLPVSSPLTESLLMDWIKSKSFPTTVREIILDEKPLDVGGRVIELGEKKFKWETERAELLNLCREKKLEVKILKVGEQLPFGVMPEPEDL